MTVMETKSIFDSTPLAFTLLGDTKSEALRSRPMMVAAAHAVAMRGIGEGVAKGVRYAELDLRGTGASGQPSNRFDYSIQSYAQDILSVLDANDQSSGHVLGYSNESDAAIQAALDAPERVVGLVLVEPATLIDPSIKKERLALAESGRIDEALRATFSFCDPTLNGEQLDAAVKMAMEFYHGNEENLVGEFRARASFNATPDMLAEIKAPTLVVGGAKSPIRQEVVRVAKSIPGASYLRIPDAGHFMVGDGPQAYAAHAINLFLEMHS